MSARPKPSGMSIVVEPGNLEARVLISAAADPATVTPGALINLARARGVEIDSAAAATLTRVAQQFVARPATVNEVFARASPPEHGERARIDWSAGFDPTDIACSAGEDVGGGRIDYYSRRTFIRVREGDHLATVIPATLGTDGRDVTGRTLPATPGAQLTITLDASVQHLSDGRLVSLRDGRLVFSGRTLKVDPVLDIEGTVSFGTGNIDFHGDVRIGHDIRDRFHVKAAGNITVEGFVDACFLGCGGDLLAHRGVAGRNLGTIEIGRNATVGYLDQVKGRIGGNLVFQRGIMRCDLQVGGDVTGESGAVVAGRLTVGGSIRVAEIGSESEPHTEIRIDPAVRNARALSPQNAARQAPIEVIRHIHAMVTLAIGGREVTFSEGVKGPIAIWVEGTRVMFRLGESEAQAISTLRAVSVRAAA